MVYVGAYLLAILATLVWVTFDRNATAAFEIFRRQLHATAREMGVYWEWVFQSLPRAILLAAPIGVAIVAAILMFRQNPWELGWNARSTLLGFMLTTSLAMLALPHLAARLRLERFLCFKAEELSSLVSIASSEKGVRQHLEPAKYEADDGWTAWHPNDDFWKDSRLWAGLVPVVYLRREAEPSLIVPVDWEYFLAWKLPRGSVLRGELMPIDPRFTVNTMHELRGREGWSVIQADIEIGEEETVA